MNLVGHSSQDHRVYILTHEGHVTLVVAWDTLLESALRDRHRVVRGDLIQS